jgi:DNA helicase-2/ATP-dependent DNA helicase PcrA
MTVHKAKGLEFPVVFLPGLVAGRFPSAGRRDPLALPAALMPDAATTDDPQVAEERRLFYVAMTRARDELVLSHAADYGGQRARRVSPFVLEALDLPAAAATPGAGRGVTGPLDRLAAFDGPATSTPAVRRRRPDEPLGLSYYAIDDYITCPARYRYGHVVRVQTAPHHAIVYGSALHAVVQEFHRRHARGQVMTDDELDASLDAAWRTEGFVSREHEEARLATARASLRRFRDAQLEPGAVIPASVERSFEFGLDGDRIRGRWDRIDIEPGDAAAPAEVPGPPLTDVAAPSLELLGRERVTITDYKSSDVRDPVRARQRARDSLQLQIYALGWEAETGRLPDALQLHFLDSGVVGRVAVDPKRIEKAKARIRQVAAGIRAGDFEARPDRVACTWCPFREICPSSAVQ